MGGCCWLVGPCRRGVVSGSDVIISGGSTHVGETPCGQGPFLTQDSASHATACDGARWAWVATESPRATLA